MQEPPEQDNRDVMLQSSHTRNSLAADMGTSSSSGLDSWLQQQYSQLILLGQDVTRDQSRMVEAGGGETFAVFKSANAEKHELQMLSAQLHFNWQNEKARLQEMRKAWACVLVENSRLKQERASTAACTQEGGLQDAIKGSGKTEKVDQCIQADLPTPKEEYLQQQLADVQQVVQHMLIMSNARMALQGQPEETDPQTLAELWPCEDALCSQENHTEDINSSSPTLQEQLDTPLLQMQPQHSIRLTQPQLNSPADCNPTRMYPLNMDLNTGLNMELPPITEEEDEGTDCADTTPADGAPAAAPMHDYPLSIPPFPNQYDNPLAWTSPKSSPKQLGALSSQALTAWISQSADALNPDALTPQGIEQDRQLSQWTAAQLDSLPNFAQQPTAPWADEQLGVTSDEAAQWASEHLKAALFKQLPDRISLPSPAASALAPPATVGESPLAVQSPDARFATVEEPASIAQAAVPQPETSDSECSVQQGWMQLELVSLGSDGGCGLLPQGCSTAQFGGSAAAAAAAAAEEQEVMDFLNSSANGSTQAPNRVSQNSDDELAPLATDLMFRLAQANSKVKSLQGEVASLQAQNALLRQQVEQQQSQLASGGRPWGGEAADGFADECADGFTANGYVQECAGGFDGDCTGE